MSNISLQNLDNYKSDYTHSTSEIFAKYKGLITEYFIQCIDNIYIKNTEYYKYILLKGVETLTHVFKMLLYTQKSFFSIRSLSEIFVLLCGIHMSDWR